jgi:hypothetical protein
MDQMTCPVCQKLVERDPSMRADRFVCKCGWVSWKTRVELLREYLDEEQRKEDAERNNA